MDLPRVFGCMASTGDIISTVHDGLRLQPSYIKVSSIK